MTRGPRPCAVAVVLLAWAIAPSSASTPAPDERPVTESIAECALLLGGDPRGRQADACIVQATRTRKQRIEAAPLLADLVRMHPDAHWLRASWAWALQSIDVHASLQRLEEVETAFRRAGDTHSQIDALSRRLNALFLFGRDDAIRETLEQLAALSAESGTPQQVAYAELKRVAFLYTRQSDFGAAWDVGRRLERERAADLAPGPRSDLYAFLGDIALRLWRLRDAARYATLARELCPASSDVTCVARTELTLFDALAGLQRDAGGPTPELQSALAATEEHLRSDPRPAIRAAARCALARFRPLPEALRETDACIDEALAYGCAERAIAALGSLSDAVGSEPHLSRHFLSQFERLGRAALLDPESFQTFRIAVVRLSLAVDTPERATARGWKLLDVLDHYRMQQSGDDAAARAGASVASFYYQFADYLRLGAGRRTEVDPLAAALHVIERLRAPTTSAAPASTVESASAEYRVLLDEIAALQRRMAERRGDGAPPRNDLEQLDVLETSEAVERARLLRRQGSGAGRTGPAIPDIESVRERLRAHEALVSFQVPADTRSHAFVAVITPTASHTVELPAARWLERASFIAGGAMRDTDSGANALAVLSRATLRPVLDACGPRVTKLVLIPDGPLHGVRFEALPEGAGDTLVLDRYEVEYAPSIASWYAAHDPALEALAPPAGAGGEADPGVRIVIAAPSLLTGDPQRIAAMRERSWTEGPGSTLDPLPGALQEGQEAARALGPDAIHLEGASATEAAVKAHAGRRVRWFHVAAHAIADEQHPERSAIVLAPGADREDGLLQPRDLTTLELRGSVVVLSACRSAAGARFPGQSALSLARAFLSRGAAAVIATVEVIRDDDARQLMSSFYRHLSVGATLADALASAKREARAAGMPAASWPAAILVGNGALVLPRATVTGSTASNVVTAALGVVLGAGPFLLVRRGALRTLARRA